MDSWLLKCVGVEDLMGSDIPTIRGTSEKASQEFGQYSGRDVFLLWQGCIFQMMYGLRIALSTMNMESQKLQPSAH